MSAPASAPLSLTPAAQELRAWREKLECNQPTLAALLGVAPETVTRWESGGFAPTPWHKALLRALAESPNAASVAATFRALGLSNALALGLAYKLTP